MSYLPAQTSIAAEAASIGARVIGRIRAAIEAAMERRAARCAYEDLLEREDRIFRDIGVTRSEVRRAARDL